MIRPIAEADVDASIALRQEALHDSPLAFGASPEADLGSDPAAVRARIADAPGSVLLGAFEADELVGLLSVFREKQPKARHRVSLFGMYVTPSHRRRGFASQLVAAALEHARSLPGAAWLQLRVSDRAPGARRVYEEAGFEPWGTEADALRHEGERATETHMALELHPTRSD